MAAKTQGIDTVDPVHNIPPAGFDPREAERTLLGHPSGLFLLFIVEMWERFSYYGMRGLLVLYMVNIIAVHQLAPGTYTNTLKMEEWPASVEAQAAPAGQPAAGTTAPSDGQTPPATAPDAQAAATTAPSPDGKPADEEPKQPLGVRFIPFHIAVGQADTSALPSAGPEPTGTNVLVIERVGEGAPSDPFSAVVVSGAPGAKGQFQNREVRYRVTNPTDKTIELHVAVDPDETTNQQYIKANSRQGADLIVNVKPDAERKADETPIEIVVETNDHDSGRNWTNAAASTMYGWYTGLAYLFPLIGGILADRFIGTHRSMILGGLLIALGHVVLAISGFGEMAQNALGLSTFIGGLALIVLGTGHFKPCVSTMVGELYRPGDPRRDGGFSIFYMGINLGAFICAFVCGTLGEQVGWHWGFGSAAVGMVAGLIIYMIGRPRLLAHVGNPPAGRPNISVLLFLISSAIAAVFAYAFHVGALGAVGDAVAKLNEPGNEVLRGVLVGGSVLAVVLAVGWFVMAQKPGDKGPTFSIFLFMLFNAFFWIAFEQAGSSMNVFAEQNTDRMVLGYEVPATWFQSINAGIIILFAPVFAWLWVWLGKRNANPTQPAKIALGLIFLAAGFVFMVLGAREALAGGLVSPLWLVAAYFLHTMGELCLSPTGLSYVTKAAPVRFVSLLMGIWFISSFIANLGGGLVAAQVESISKGEIDLPWNIGGTADFFMLFVVVPGAVGVLVLLFTPLLKKLLRNQND